MWNVYVLKSSHKRWYYVGSTNRLDKRVAEHNKGKVSSTTAYKPLELVYVQSFTSEKSAREYEQKLKAKRVEKEALISQIEKET